MKKKSIIFAAALSAVMAMSVTASPCAYAVKDTAAVTEVAEKEKDVKGKELGKFTSYEYAIAEAADSDGTVYFRSGTADSSVIFTTDSKGNRLNSYTFTDYYRFTNRNPKIKPLNDCVVFTYPGEDHDYIVKLDKELNEIGKYEVEKCRDFDSDGEKLLTVTKTSICLSDFDGKNKETLWTASEGITELHCGTITDKYIAFGGTSGDYSDIKAYCGIIDRSTGEVTVKQQDREIYDVTAFGGTIVWRTKPNYFGGNTSKKYDKGEFYIYDGKDFNVLGTDNVFDKLAVDSEGNIITCCVTRKNDRLTVNVYKNNHEPDSFEIAGTDESFYNIAANGGVLAVCTAPYPANIEGKPYMNVRLISYSE